MSLETPIKMDEKLFKSDSLPEFRPSRTSGRKCCVKLRADILVMENFFLPNDDEFQ